MNSSSRRPRLPGSLQLGCSFDFKFSSFGDFRPSGFFSGLRFRSNSLIVVLCLQTLIGSLVSDAQTITRITDQILHNYRSSSPGYFINLTADKVLFTAAPDGISERVPFVTDSTTAGTIRLLPSLPAGTTMVGGFHLLGSNAYFFTYESGAAAGSFWKTDGTPGGTVLVTSQAPREIYSVDSINGKLIGIAIDYPDSYLWASDGTSQGTGTILLPPNNASINWGGVVNGAYYFSLPAVTAGEWRETIWKSDGTTAGTVAVKTLSHQASGVTSHDRNPTPPAFLDGSMYFLATESALDPFYGDYYDRSVLWKIDGTSAGTVRLGNYSSLWHRIYAFGGSLFIEKNGSVDAYGAVSPPQVMRSNGTIAGSTTVFYGNNPQSYTSMQRMGKYGSHIYYNASHYNIMYPSFPRYSVLLRMASDGSFETLANLPSGWNYATGDQLSNAHILASRPSALYLGIYGGVNDVWRLHDGIYLTIDKLGAGAVASDATIDGYMIGAGNNFTTGTEVYSSQAGHTLIADLAPGSGSSNAAYSGFQGGPKATLGNILLYSGQDPAGGTELWRSDGTAQGTFRLKDISNGPTHSSITGIYPANGFAWFVVMRGDLSPAFTVAELWKTDGTNAGTTFVRRCPESETWIQFYADQSRIVAKRSSLDYSSNSLEILDGPGAGEIVSLGTASPESIVLSGGSIWWQESDGSSKQLKRSAGTGSPAQTVVLPESHTQSSLEIPFGDGVICTTISPGYIYNVLWVRPNGSVNLFTHEGYPYFHSFREHGGRLFFVEDASLYASGGTANSAVELHTSGRVGDGSGDGFVSHQGALYFTSKEFYESPITIWKTHGTPASTTLTPITTPPTSSSVSLISNGDWLLYPYEYYNSTSNEYIQQARRSSGLEEGEPIPGMSSADFGFYSSQKHLTPFPSGIVFFNRMTSESGDELYKLELPAAPPTSPFDIWAQTHGLAGTAGQPHEDPDGDGVSNLIEFYSGTHPNQHTSHVKPAFFTIDALGTPVQAIAIPRVPGTGLSLVVESSVDLVHWNPDVTIAPDGTHTYALSKRAEIHSRLGSSPETITFAIPPTTYPKAFIRFRVVE
jgi:ELWxxDGT repeat protein